MFELVDSATGTDDATESGHKRQVLFDVNLWLDGWEASSSLIELGGIVSCLKLAETSFHNNMAFPSVLPCENPPSRNSRLESDSSHAGISGPRMRPASIISSSVM